MRDFKLLAKYQHGGLDFMWREPRCALWYDMGLGKTVTVLTAVKEFLELGEVQRVLVIAPKRVAQSVWAQECREWSHLQRVRINVCVGEPKKRVRSLDYTVEGRGRIMTINPENLKWLKETLDREYDGMEIGDLFDMIVFDEASLFKGHDSKRFKLMEEVCCDRVELKRGVRTEIKSKVKRVVQLTATPMTSGLQNLWSQMKLLDHGARLGVKITHFRKAFLVNTAPPGSEWAKWEPQAGAIERVQDMLADIVQVLRAEDYLEMPEFIERDIEVEIPTAVRAAMRQLEKDFVLRLENGEDVIANNSGSLGNKLLQYANGAVYTGDPTEPDYEKKWGVVHDAKIDALKEIVETATAPLLISYWFESDLERITRAFPNMAHIDDRLPKELEGKYDSMIEAWNKGEVPNRHMLIHPASAGHGLNLQHGGATIVMFSLFWPLETYIQFIGRIYRQGQEEVVRVLRIVVRNSREKKVAAGLRIKTKNQKQLVDGVLERNE